MIREMVTFVSYPYYTLLYTPLMYGHQHLQIVDTCLQFFNDIKQWCETVWENHYPSRKVTRERKDKWLPFFNDVEGGDILKWMLLFS